MSKNFLLSKASVLILVAIVFLSFVVPAWSMEGENEKDQNNNSAITVKNSNNVDENENNNGDERNNTSAQDYFSALPLELKVPILEMVAFNFGEAKRGLSNLALVCKDWNINIINNDSEGDTIRSSIRQAWIYGRCGRNDIIDSEEQKIFSRFYKSALIYRPLAGSDEGMIRLPISDLRNPLEGTFDLPQCALATFEPGQGLSIATGYRKAKIPANVNKLEIWFTPWFLVNKEMPQLASNHYLRVIKGDWNAAKVPIGIFWTNGGWNAADEMIYGDYLVSESMDRLGSENLLRKFQRSNCGSAKWWSEGWRKLQNPLRNFHISFVDVSAISQTVASGHPSSNVKKAREKKREHRIQVP